MASRVGLACATFVGALGLFVFACGTDGDATVDGTTDGGLVDLDGSTGGGDDDGDDTVANDASTDGATIELCDGAPCPAPTHDDGRKNLDETDVDCGGAVAPRCAQGKTCAVHGDCASDGCDYSGHCALSPSCTQHHGGDTCGAGDETSPGKAHESCCTAIPVPGRTLGAAPLRMDKYQVTAGRMRVFLERVNGNPKKWVEDHRDALPDYAKASLPAALDAYLPEAFTGANTSVDRILGGTEFTSAQNLIGCSYGNPNDGQYSSGAATYWMDGPTRTAVNEYPNLATQTKDRLDEKALNCGIYPLYAAFCAWDGGVLESIEDYTAARGDEKYPWGDEPKFAGFRYAGDGAQITFKGKTNNYCACNGVKSTDCECGVAADCFCSPEYTNFSWNYGNSQSLPLYGETFSMDDYSAFVAPPGRYPKGVGPYGHMDLAGNVHEMTSTLGTIAPVGGEPAQTGISVVWTPNGSFEVHSPDRAAPTKNALVKYGKTGLRCVRP